MPLVKVRENESFENALRKFKKACEREGILSEVRKREHYDKPSVKKNDVIQFQLDQFQKTPWTSTVIGVTEDNITLRHNAIPETKVQSMYGNMIVRFNETKFTIDENHELAGRTLIFNVTVVSIETEKAQNATK